jgi:hypothetical protein
MGRLTNKIALVTGGSSGIGNSKLEIRDGREAELPAMFNATKASYESAESGVREKHGLFFTPLI